VTARQVKPRRKKAATSRDNLSRPKRKRVTKKSAARAREDKPKTRQLVLPSAEEPKSGCQFCSLLPYSKDFKDVSSGYQRDAEKILAKEMEPHAVHTRCVEQANWTKVDVLFIGEAPGRQEDNMGEPFVGRAGDVLRSVIAASSVLSDEACGITNTVRCLHNNATVYTAAGRSKIGDLVRQEYRGLVWSYDAVKGSFVQARVTATYTSALGDRHWLHVGYLGSKRNGHGKTGVTVTNDHEFLTEGGCWVRADELDGCRVNTGPVGLGSRRRSIAVGTLLGDGHISKKSAGLSWSHCAAQREWLVAKAQVFGAVVSGPTARADGKGSPVVRARTEASRGLAELREAFYPAGKKIVPESIADDLDSLALATLFLDNGYVRVRAGRRPLAEIATVGFDTASVERLAHAISSVWARCTPQRGRLVFDAEATEDLLVAIAAHVPPSMRYKLGALGGLADYEPLSFAYEAPAAFFAEAVVTAPADALLRAKTAYCLSVEGTENFVTAGGVAHNCRPPRNRNPNKTEIKSCTPQLVREIKARKPKVLVALGNVPLEYLTGHKGITTMNGRVFDCIVPGFEGYKVVGCLHPAYVLRADHEMIRFIEAIEVVQAFIAGNLEEKAGAGEYRVIDTLDGVRKLMRKLRRSKTPVGVDTETGSLNPFQSEFPALLCFSFSDKEGVGYTVPFDHDDSPWCLAHGDRKAGKRARAERKLVKREIRRFLESQTPKVLQNAKFDAKHIRVALGCDIVNYQDTMLIHLCLDERHGTHGLKTLAFEYTGMGGYDKPLDDYKESHREANPDRDGGSYANIPGETLFPYAAMDADVTVRVYNGLSQHPEFTPQFQRLSGFLHRLSVALTDVEFQGAQVNFAVAKQLDKHYSRLMRAATKKIHALETVQEFARDRGIEGKDPEFNPGSHEQLQDILFGDYGEQPIELTDKGFEVLTLRYERRVKEWRKSRAGAKPRFQAIIRDSIKREEWRNFSTKADVLQALARKGNELAPLILEYRAADTLWKTFARPLTQLLDENGCVHGTYNIIGTVTGRLSSSEPNLQNIPNKGGGLIKSAYVSRFGEEGLIGQVDYSQVELRVAASWFNDPTMIQAYVDGADLHRLTALDITGMTEESYAELEQTNPSKAKEIRTEAKRINFGILYGGGPPALQTALAKDGLFLSIDQCKKLIQRYFEVRPKLKQGIEKLEADVCAKGYLESFTGRRRRVPEVFSESEEIVSRALRQSVNFPIQCGASEMTLMALVLIYEEMARRGYRSKMILTVHDSIIFDLHVDEAFEVLSLAKQIMEELPDLSEQVLPGLSWSWLKVPIVADCEIGVDWRSLVDMDPNDFIGDELEPEDELWEWNEKEDGWVLGRKPKTIDELWEAMEWKVNKAA